MPNLPEARQDPKKQRRRFTDAEKIELAKSHYEAVNVTGEPERIKMLAQRSGRHESVVSRAIKDVFTKDHLVELRIQLCDGVDKKPTRVSQLESKLQQRFPQLRRAIVVDADGLPPPAHNEAARRAYSDSVHKDLGKSLADFIAEGALIRDGDAIGLSSGRGIYYTIQSLPALHVSNITLMSLTGTLYPADHTGTEVLPLDADIHVSLLQRLLMETVTIRRIIYPLVYDDERQLSIVRERTCLGADNWAKNPATHAIVGVGVLSLGHRFYEEIKNPKTGEDLLVPIRASLEALVKICDQYSSTPYCPVADIANRLFFVHPPRSIRLRPTDTEKIGELTSEINKKLLNVQENQLHEIKTIILVAGTIKKALAIRELLLHEPYRIQFLCTDNHVARILLGQTGVS